MSECAAFKPYKTHSPSFSFSIVIVKDALVVLRGFVASTFFVFSLHATCKCVHACVCVRTSISS